MADEKKAILRIRRGTASEWGSANPTLADGEQGHETDTGRRKIGDGSTAWNSLDYMYGTAATADVTTSATDTTAGRVTRIDDITAKGLPAKSGGELPSQFDSPTIIIPDTLRASVEAASGGRATVLYDDQGYPSYMVRIPAFNREDIHSDFGTGRHPAFVVNGTAKAEMFVGMHQATVYNNRALSLPGLDPTVNIDWDEANTYCTNKGTGWHLMTNWEWAAVSLWVLKQVADGILDNQPRGNTDHGRAHDEYQEVGTRQDGSSYVPGDSAGSARTLTGSGPAGWRHDLSSFGIADLVGNVWEWIGGLKIVDGAIKMPADNYYGQDDASWADQDATITDSNPWSSDGVTLGGTADGELLKAALIDPATVSDQANGRLYVNESGERVPRRGGHWGYASSAGLAALFLNNTRSNSFSSVGFRPAFVA